ncbi:MAG: hypothetical protein IT287_01470 [Bdellovibrionaceae bacterium]|nr:hypothetical protein [Pseudobdellovibrionaceae bacterium]
MNKLIIFLCALSLTACGVTDAIDSVNATPEKMDAMNTKMGDMQAEMSKTNESIRLQKVAIAKENLDDPKNATVLMPVPVGLMGYAKLFAENATLEEIAGQVYLYLKEVNDGIYPKLVDDTGAEIEFTMQEVANINQSKLHKYTAAQAICGLLPQSVVEELVAEYIYKENRYQKTAYNILMMRYQFLRDVMLNGSVLTESIEDVGSLEKAYEYVSYMDWIARRPFLNKINVKAYGFLPPLGEFYEELTVDAAKDSLLSMYDVILSRSKNVEKVQMQSFTGDAAQDAQLFVERTQRLNTVLNSVAADVQYWQAK